MKRFETLTGVAIPFGAKNVDTDLILPARYLKVVTRAGLGVHAFETMRTTPDNIFDSPRNAGAPILIAGDNFGCGSSREHAPWALVDMGIRAIIAPSFADIFAGNAVKNGILLVSLPQGEVDRLLAIASDHEIAVDLAGQRVITPAGDHFGFEIDPFRKTCLIEGLDEIGLTERMTAEIARFEDRLDLERPWISDAAGRKRAA